MNSIVDTNYCSTCLRPPKRCLCAFIKRVENSTPVFILQHSKERFHPKGTAQLAHLCLTQCTLISDKTFHQPLSQLLSNYTPALLWPDTQPSMSNRTNNGQVLKVKTLEESDCGTHVELAECNALIIIDGTWKKANKIFHTHSELHTLPRCDIQHAKNQYKIRKSPSEQHLSTLEAIYFGLHQLNSGRGSEPQIPSRLNDPVDDEYLGLLEAQSLMIQQWQDIQHQHQHQHQDINP